MITESIIVVRYAETDQMGIVHHSHYPVWYECARSDYVRQLGFGYGEMEAAGVFLPLVEMGSRFLAPACYDERLTVRAKIGKLMLATIRFDYEVLRGEKLLNRGFTLHAFTDREMKPFSLKKRCPDYYRLLEASME